MCVVLLFAFSIDGLIGDPRWFYNRVPHPVTWMATILMAGEKTLNKAHRSREIRRFLGLFWAIFCYSLCFGCAFYAQELIQTWDSTGFVLALLGSVFLAYRSLMDHVQSVEKALLCKDIIKARTEVSKIVGRDTTNLDKKGVTRAAIESLAENFSDGLVAPAFWFALGGLPGIVTYKMINTADSMIGNRSERFEAFGWASAKIDDLVNFVPARLTVLLFIIVTWASRSGNVKTGLQTAFQFQGLHASPNAGWPEATMAGLLNVRLGGPRHYKNGSTKDSAWLGHGNDVEVADLTLALKIIKLSWATIILFLIIGAVL